MDWVLLATGGAFGLLAGSFLNVVIHRGPALWKLVEDESRQGNLARPRSYCPSCRAQLRAYHLIPLISYLVLRGKCTACGSPIPIRYPLVEFVAAGAGMLAFAIGGAPGPAAAAALFFWMLIALAVIDFETGYLPDVLTLPLLALGLIANAAGMFTPLIDAAIGAVFGFGAFWLIGFAFKKARGIEGLGQGDAKLLAALGAWLGWQALAPIVFIAALMALVGVGLAALLGQKVTRETPLPFGPALAAAGAVVMVLLSSEWFSAILYYT